MLTSHGVLKGIAPPPPFVSVATTLMCLSITAFTYFMQGRSGAAMSVAAFCLLALNVLGNRKPTFSQLTSSVFGLFYCGECMVTGRLGSLHIFASYLRMGFFRPACPCKFYGYVSSRCMYLWPG